MTNRTKILQELQEMSTKEFAKQLRWPPPLDVVICQQCEEAHGGYCPVDEEDECPRSVEAWLDEECTVERILPRIEEE